VSALRRLIRKSRVDVVVPTIDRHVQALSDARAELRGKVFLPAERVITLCRDNRLIRRRRHGRPAPASVSGAPGRRCRRHFIRLGVPRPQAAAHGNAHAVGCRPTPRAGRRSGWWVWEAMQGV
jgi:hypothetical protein